MIVYKFFGYVKYLFFCSIHWTMYFIASSGFGMITDMNLTKKLSRSICFMAQRQSLENTVSTFSKDFNEFI